MNRQVKLDAKRPQTRFEKRVELGEVIGKGGMGVVLEAHDTNLKRTAAIKMMDPKMAKDDILVRQFIEEAQITAQLDHPQLVPVHELGITKKGSYFFTMKQVQGQSLEEVLASQSLAERTPEDLFRLLRVFLKVCDAVSFAHSRGVLHLDLKPHNIMMGEHGEVYLMDWGLARLVGPDVTEGGQHHTDLQDRFLVGTLEYMAPERAAEPIGQLDERTDIFSLGGILYKIISIKPPFLNSSTEELRKKVLAGRIPPPQQVADGPVSPWLSKIAMKALSPNPANRYDSTDEMQRDVAKFMRSGWHYPRRMIEPGTRIICEGEVGHEAYILLDGHCKVFKEMDGQRIVMHEMGPGEVFGETAVLTGAPRAASVEATDRVMLAVLTRELFEQEIGANFWMGQFMKTLADRFREMTERVSELELELENAKKSEC